MIGIVIVANGNLGRELLCCVEQILGARPAAMLAVSLDGDYRRDEKQDEICRAISEVEQGQGVIVVTDAIGSSPANLSARACTGPNRVIIAGANLPMLLKLSKCRNCELEDAAGRAVEAGRKYVTIHRGDR
ncbi:MAG: PTS fructose transporter subunit IIA [Rhodobacteraceae bacterium]|nr:PTS fructose transporter subunit IIA [Paracoccaceae bacterium]